MDKMIKVVYELTEVGQKKSILSGGNGKRIQDFTTPATEKLIELSKVDAEGNLVLNVSIPQYTTSTKYENDKDFSWDKRMVGKFYSNITSFDDIQTIESILEQYNSSEVNKEKLEQELIDSNINEENYNKALQDYLKRLEKNKEHEKEIAEKKEKESILKKKYEEDKIKWIIENGSQYLKDCLAMDIKANKEYVLDRVSFEHKGYEVDYSDNAKWDEKVSPSIEAVEELKKLRANNIECEIVWLTRPINDEEYDYDNQFENCESIVIRNYLGKYDLVKIM